jgi:subtilisin family serine protease
VTDAIGGQQWILSTWPAGSVQDDSFGGRTTLNGDSRFAYLVGTSMAAPQVAGVAALIRAVKPNMPNTSVVHLIKATASHCGSYGDGIGWGMCGPMRLSSPRSTRTSIRPARTSAG